MIFDLRQSLLYAKFMESLGWKAIKLSTGQFIYLKKFPLFGGFIKAPRINLPFSLEEIEKYAKKNSVFRVIIEPKEINMQFYSNLKKYGYKINLSPYSPTKTVIISLKNTPERLFNFFSSERKRAIKRAIKNRLEIRLTKDINLFLKIPSFLPFFLNPLFNKETKKFWAFFSKNNSFLLIASYQKKPIAGLLIATFKNCGYYWQARNNNYGKNLGAPSLLVFEAFKILRKYGFDFFDFEGIYDPRFPVKSWLGFSHFKQGFGGKILSLPGSFIKNYFRSKFLKLFPGIA